MSIEQNIISNILNNPDYFSIVSPHIKQEYFHEPKYQKVLDLTFSFFDKYSKVPSYEALRISSEKLSIDENTYNDVIEVIESAEHTEPEGNVEWLTNETEEFCKQQALFNALSYSVQIKANSEAPLNERNNKMPDVGAIPDLMRDALAIAFDSSVGHDYFGDAEERHANYSKQSKKFSFGPGLESLDALTGGGVESGTLNLILAPVNCFIGEEEIEVYMTDEQYQELINLGLL